MKPLKIFRALTPLLLAALLLSLAAPATRAQRRRARPQTRTRTTRHLTTAATARPAPTPSNPEAARPASVTLDAQPSPTPRVEADERARPEPDASFEELVSSDAYGVYVEVRHLGTLAQTPELKTAVGSIKLVAGLETKPATDVLDFLLENSEPLAEARAVFVTMRARNGVPAVLLALEFPTPREAAAFEPKFRRFADAQFKSYEAMYPKKAETASAPQSRNRAGARGGASPTPARRNANAPSEQSYSLTRYGRVLFSSDSKFSLRRLRGDEAVPALADAARFQAARARFASDSLFVYVDTGVTVQGWQKTLKDSADAEPEGGASAAGTVAVRTGRTIHADEVQTAAPTVVAESTPKETPDPEGGGEPEEGDDEKDASRLTPAAAAALAAAPEEQPAKPSEEQLAVAGLGGVLQSLWGGMPRIPDSFALGARLDSGALAVRVSVDNSPDGRVNVLPFLPNIVAGPPVTAEAAEVAPDDADIFFTTTLDWEQVYLSTLGTAESGLPSTLGLVMGGDIAPPAPGDARAVQAVAAVEKVFGFKFKEDLLPSLGNEVALSMPFDTSDFGLGRARSEKKEEKDSEPGMVVIISLNDPEKIEKILPRVFLALGMTPVGDRPSATEKREGFEIHGSGGLVYTIINRFLVLGSEPKAVRHVVDSYVARRTLAYSDTYRDSTGWQAPQKIVQAYVSDSVMRATVEQTKARSGTSTDPLVRALLDQLEAPAEAASFLTTNEGDALVHEVRLPLSMIRAYSLSMMINVRDAPVLSGETMASFALTRLLTSETEFKESKKKGRYGSLEELVAEQVLEKEFMKQESYRIELSAVGEKFEATATPKEYGKTGRRSFFVDESGTVRAADHQGKPATASDPPVD
jgi:Protein of unknown function (DUF3352)